MYNLYLNITKAKEMFASIGDSLKSSITWFMGDDLNSSSSSVVNQHGNHYEKNIQMSVDLVRKIMQDQGFRNEMIASNNKEFGLQLFFNKDGELFILKDWHGITHKYKKQYKNREGFSIENRTLAVSTTVICKKEENELIYDVIKTQIKDLITEDELNTHKKFEKESKEKIKIWKQSINNEYIKVRLVFENLNKDCLYLRNHPETGTIVEFKNKPNKDQPKIDLQLLESLKDRFKVVVEGVISLNEGKLSTHRSWFDTFCDPSISTQDLNEAGEWEVLRS